MKGLLRKDWYILKGYGRTYLPLILLICLIPGIFGGVYVLMLALALPRSTIASDEVCWDRMAAMLPYRTAEVVGGKYLLYGACIALGTALTAGSIQTQQAVTRVLNARGLTSIDLFHMSWMDIAEYALLQGGFALLIAALSIPLYYRFTARKGALLSNLLVIVCISAAGTLSFNSLYRAPTGNKAAAVGILWALAAVGGWISFRLSVRFYRKRQRGLYQD